MKIMFSCIHFPKWPYPPKNNEKKKIFYTGKLYGLTGVSYVCVQATEKELEHYKGREDRETRLRVEKEELLTNKKELEETLASKENV